MKAALFDFDGVVVDTEPQYTVFWGGIFEKYYPGQRALATKIKGQTLEWIYEKYFPDEERRKDITAALNNYEHGMRYPYVAGFEQYIAKLRAQGVPTAIVTSSNKVKMEQVYRQHPELKDFFDAILTSEDFSKSKPDPDCYLKGAARLGVKAKDCVVFEDSYNGLCAARAAGCRVVGVATTNSAENIAPYCDMVIKNFMI